MKKIESIKGVEEKVGDECVKGEFLVSIIDGVMTLKNERKSYTAKQPLTKVSWRIKDNE